MIILVISGFDVCSNHQALKRKDSTGLLKPVVIASIIGSFSGLGSFVERDEPVQRTLAAFLWF